MKTCDVFSHYNFQIENIPCQGYDESSNMRGKWTGLQALFLRECSYAYYVHCLAHKLQLTLIAKSREAKYVHQFFIHLTSIINIVVDYSKCNDDCNLLKLQRLKVWLLLMKLRLEWEQTKLVLCNELEILDSLLIFNMFVAW
jgi:hypothetical protein